MVSKRPFPIEFWKKKKDSDSPCTSSTLGIMVESKDSDCALTGHT